MFYLEGNHIYLTRGDTAYMTINLRNADGTAYVPQEGDALRLICKKGKEMTGVSIDKAFDMSALRVILVPSATEHLSQNNYSYKVKMTDHNGLVTTVIDDELTLL